LQQGEQAGLHSILEKIIIWLTSHKDTWLSEAKKSYRMGRIEIKKGRHCLPFLIKLSYCWFSGVGESSGFCWDSVS
jgi:hypothetical protein